MPLRGSRAKIIGMKISLVLILFCVSGFAEKLELIRKIPHSGYSEGIEFHDGVLWNAFPKKIVKIDPKDGTILETFPPASDYSESITFLNGKLWNVSFSDDGIYSAKFGRTSKKADFKRVGTAPEDHAWGLCTDGKQLIMSGNYSYSIYFYDPKTVKQVRKITTPVKDLEDCAWDGRGIWTSSFTSHRGQIFWVDPVTGAIPKFYDLPEPEACPVIDGIAFDGKALWVTGKECPAIYQVKMPAELPGMGKKK